MSGTSQNFLQNYDNAPSFSDDAEAYKAANARLGLEGNKIKIEDLLGKRIVFLAFKVRPSNFKRFGDEVLMVQVLVDGEKRVFFTQSQRIRSMLSEFEHLLPRTGTIVQENRAWRIQ